MLMKRGSALAAAAACALLAACAAAPESARLPGTGWLAVSANDNKVVLIDGVLTVLSNPPPDTLALIDLKQNPPKLVAEIDMPAGTVDGPPGSVAVTPDEGLALVASGLKINPADPARQVDDNRVIVVDLKANPPKVIATLVSGARPTGIAITPDGRFALVANRGDGTVAVLSINGKEVTKIDTVRIADDKSGPVHVAITPDGKSALVTRDGDSRVSVLAIENGRVTYTRRDMRAGIQPYHMSMNPSGRNAVVGVNGRGGVGDIDTISVIDLSRKPYRVVETVSVDQWVEGLVFSPDGRHVAVVAMNGSNRPRNYPFYNDAGKLVMFRLDGMKLTRVAEAPIGHWSQGVVFSPDGKTILVGNMVEKNLGVYGFDGTNLTDTGQRIAVKGGAAALSTAGGR